MPFNLVLKKTYVSLLARGEHIVLLDGTCLRSAREAGLEETWFSDSLVLTKTSHNQNFLAVCENWIWDAVWEVVEVAENTTKVKGLSRRLASSSIFTSKGDCVVR